jgi:hypothetical protein
MELTPNRSVADVGTLHPCLQRIKLFWRGGMEGWFFTDGRLRNWVRVCRWQGSDLIAGLDQFF